MGKQSKARQARRRQPGPGRGTGGAEATLLAQLDLLARRRAPYGDLLAAIVADAFARFPPGRKADGDRDTGGDGVPAAILEIGAGDGALRGALASDIAARTIHTDPSRAALGRLRGRRDDEPGATGGAGEARVAVARAQSLPFGDRAFGAVVGLCVFDAIHATGGEAAAVAEIARVLAPGGRFVHILDMATLLDAPFAKLAASGLVPIPNVFGDPSDHAWPLDVLLLRRDWLAGLLELAARAGHSSIEMGTLGRVPIPSSDARSARPSRAPLDSASFMELASDGERRLALSRWFASACRLAVHQGYPTLQPLPFHSGRYLASVLETAFKDSGAFRVELSEIVTRSAWRPRGNTDRGPTYRSLALGHERVLGDLPARLLDESARAPPTHAGSDETLVELGAYLFVATRI
jgi:SAM-dependent methyltransferase